MTTPAAPFADLEAELAASLVAGFANVSVTPEVGASFSAILDVETEEAWGQGATVTAYTLTYLSSVTLSKNQILTLADGRRLRVAENPRLRTQYECVVGLVPVGA